MNNFYRNIKSIFHISVVFLIIILFTVSCAKEPLKPDSSDTKDKAFYTLAIKRENAPPNQKIPTLIGNGVDSNWDSDLGLIWLGTDKNNLPTGTLTITIDSIGKNPVREGNVAFVSYATLSTVDKLVGTASEINGKLYNLANPYTQFVFLEKVTIGANYITSEYFDLPMVDAKTGEFTIIRGSFTAISK